VGRIRDAVVWSKPLRRLLYPVDLAIFLAIRFYVATVRRRVLLTDRYFYDMLVDVTDDGRGFWVRLLERLTPEPDIAVFLEVSPEESYARKGEYSVAYLARRSAAYRRIAPLVPSAVVLPNADLDTTCRALERAVDQRLSA
jgi:thymidylate kinase